MKRINLFLCASIALASLLVFSCKPDVTDDDGKDKDKQEQNNNNNNNNNQNQQPAYVSLVKVDGNFSDWDELPQENVKTVASDPASKRQTFTQASFYADEACLFIRVKLNPNPDSLDVQHNNYAMHVYLDIDNNPETGGYLGQPWEFINFGADIQLEKEMWNSSITPSDFTPSVEIWPANEAPGPWETWVQVASRGTVGHSVFNQEELELELCVYFDGLPLDEDELGATIGAGVSILRNWKPVGAIPNGPVTAEDEYGRGQFVVLARNV